MKAWRILSLDTLEASLHMAVDEALLRLHAQGKSPPTVRFYQWAPPAISLGRFQSFDGVNVEACRRLGLSVVRRSTGGRAVLHQGDLTYSVVAGTADGVPATLAASYRRLGEGLIEGLRLLGVDAEPGREATGTVGLVVCFLRSAGGDLTHRGRKFVGSAQTWRGESLLQHGSVLLAPQAEVWAELLGAAASESLRARLTSRTTSIGEILGRPVEAGEVAQALARGLERVLGIRLEPGALTPEEWALAREIAPKEFPALCSPNAPMPDPEGRIAPA
ncbi:MAG: lipoate--protein ligase family protein [Deltaproteobacteria bacterium]|nr:lipoate--protein ligase family protein [Deltaproteobacteria bacterium]